MRINTDQSILILMTHVKLGDFLLLTPYLQELQKIYPSVLIAIPDILYDLFDEQKIFSRFIHLKNVDRFLKNSKERFQILDLSYPLIQNLMIPESHILLNTSHFKKLQHSTESYSQALKEFFPQLSEKFQVTPFLNFNSQLKILNAYEVEEFKYFTIHSGSDFAPKNWSPDKFEKTVELILKKFKNLQCLNFVGPKDIDLFQDKEVPRGFRSIKANLKEVAHLLASSLFHIDNDSGIHHLAGAIDVPSITVFGPTGPGTWSSITKNNFVHWGGPYCPNHCHGMKAQECPDRVCLSSIQPEELVVSAERILSAYNHLDIDNSSYYLDVFEII